MDNYLIPYGDTTLRCPIDGAKSVVCLSGNQIPALENIRETLYGTLNHPADAAPLSQQVHSTDQVVLIISDMTRYWMRQDLLVPHIVDYLQQECALPLSQLTILVANGTHPGGDEKDLRTLVTDAVYEQVRVINHDCQATDLVYMGTTDYNTEVFVNPVAANADLCICLGAATYHCMAGFGGGRKSILPGISSWDTVQHNHSFSLAPDAFCSNPKVGNGVLEGNPLHLDMCQAAGMMKKLFMINLVVNAQEELCGIYSGHYIRSWLQACEKVKEVYQVPIREKFDVVIAGCGGYPRDMSLYQGTKAVDNVEGGVKDGGTLVLMIEAREGGGPEEFFGWSKNQQNGTMEQRLREQFTVAGYVFFRTCEQAKRYRMVFLSSLDPELVKPLGIEAYPDMDTLMANVSLEGKSVCVIPNGGSVVPYVKGGEAL